MGLSAALIIGAIGVAGLLWLDRNTFYQPSSALWLPLIFLWVVGSRPLSVWLGIWFGVALWTPGPGLEAQMDGSPLDAAIYVAMLAIGIAILARRRHVKTLIKTSSPLIIYYAYCLLSVSWSHIPEVAFKRWVKDICDVVIVLLIVTDKDPAAALQWTFTRVGYVLFPASIILSKYSPLGRAYDPDGVPLIVGVSTNKNSLGMAVYVILIGVFWSAFCLATTSQRTERSRRLFAQGTLLATGLAVLAMARSATSIACFALGATLIVSTHMPFIRRQPKRLHILVATILLLGGAMMMLGGEGTMAGALGRDTTFTGRTDIWKTVIPMCPNVLVGAGFESFWNTYGGNLVSLGKYLKGINSAHDGYIETYVNLGIVGLFVMGIVLIDGYQRVCMAFRRNQKIGSLALAYLATSIIYSVTEAGFRVLTMSWISLLISVAASSGVLVDAVKVTSQSNRMKRSQKYLSKVNTSQAKSVLANKA